MLASGLAIGLAHELGSLEKSAVIRTCAEATCNLWLACFHDIKGQARCFCHLICKENGHKDRQHDLCCLPTLSLDSWHCKLSEIMRAMYAVCCRVLLRREMHHLGALFSVQINCLMPITLIPILIACNISTQLLIASVMSVWSYQNQPFGMLLQGEAV